MSFIITNPNNFKYDSTTKSIAVKGLLASGVWKSNYGFILNNVNLSDITSTNGLFQYTLSVNTSNEVVCESSVFTSNELTVFPPLYTTTTSAVTSYSKSYGFIEFNTTENIVISGIVDASGMGYIGGDGGGGDASKGKGLYGSLNKGGYFGNSTNSDPLNLKTPLEAINISSFYLTEKYRNCVFPGCGGSGGSGTKSGAGGCGGGVIRLIADKNIEFIPTALVKTTGKRDGGNGVQNNLTSQMMTDVGVTCRLTIGDLCQGTRLGVSTTQLISQANSAWPRMTNGIAGRSLGNSSGGSIGNCCYKQKKVSGPPYRVNEFIGGSGTFFLGFRNWSSCTNASGDDGSNHFLNSPYANWCNTGVAGQGGAGGGVLLKSKGEIKAQPSNFNLLGYGSDKSNGGTLKIFSTGNISNTLFLNDDPTSNQPSVLLSNNIGGFYSEVFSGGFCLDKNNFKIQSLSSSELISISSNDIYNKSFEIAFTEGFPVIAATSELKIVGYDLYRLIDISGNNYQGPEKSPPLTSIDWKFIKQITPQNQIGDYNINTLSSILVNSNGQLIITNPAPRDYYLQNIGPQVSITPIIGSTDTDTYGRTWVYTVTGWNLQNINQAFCYYYKDDQIYNDLTLQGYTISETNEIINNISNAKTAIWYRIEPRYLINGGIASPCELYIHPEVTNPNMSISLAALRSTPYDIGPLTPSITGRIAGSDVKHYDKYYDDLNRTLSSVAYGYDDLEIQAIINVDSNTFYLSGYLIDWGLSEPIQNALAPYVNYYDDKTVNYQYKTYTTPTQIGRVVLSPYKNKAFNTVSISAIFNKNAYNLTATNYIFATAQNYILEREPTPIFWMTPKDVPSVNRSDSKPVGDNGADKYLPIYDSFNTYHTNRVISGFCSGVKVEFYDESIARSFPISGWTINYDRFNNDIRTETIVSNNFADMQQLRPDFNSAIYNVTAVSSVMYSDCGIYYPTLVVQASTTNTGRDLSAVNRIYIYPPNPTANFVSIVSGFVPLNISALDTTTTIGTISAWIWELYDSQDRTSISQITATTTGSGKLTANWKWHTDNYELSNITVDSSLNNLCLTVRTTSYGWRGSSDASKLRFGDKFIFASDKICKHIVLYERPQVAAIKVLSAITYNSSFSDDTPNFATINAFNNVSYVSGYSPYLKITFQENCSAKSYPISSYYWNFGNYFSDINTASSIEVSANSLITNGWSAAFPTDHGITGDDNYPQWTTNASNHKVEQIYTLPGDYLVTLTTKVSTTNTTRTTNLSVHVEENPPKCSLLASYDKMNWMNVSAISGTSPLTVYFTTTGSIAGSFPIGTLLLDFGDGSNILTINRYVNNYNNSLYGSDPRYYNNGIIEHTYIRKLASDLSSFNVSLSVLADFSNTIDICSANNTISKLLLPSFPINDIHLIKNRSYTCNNDKLLILQKESDKTTYNILVSGD